MTTLKTGVQQSSVATAWFLSERGVISRTAASSKRHNITRTGGTKISIFETQTKASPVCWSLLSGR